MKASPMNKTVAKRQIRVLRATPVIFVGIAMISAGKPKANNTLAMFDPMTLPAAS